MLDLVRAARTSYCDAMKLQSNELDYALLILSFCRLSMVMTCCSFDDTSVPYVSQTRLNSVTFVSDLFLLNAASLYKQPDNNFQPLKDNASVERQQRATQKSS